MNHIDPILRPRIDAALASSGLLTPIPAELRQHYHDMRMQAHRLHNRRTVIGLIVIFDLFWISQFRSAPELVPLSGLLRFGLVTPLGLAFVLLDRRDRLGRAYDATVVALTGACALASAWLCIRTTSLTTLSDIRATPLILLTTGLQLRFLPPAVLANAAICTAAFITGLLLSPIVPAAELGGLIFTELANAIIVCSFSMMLERRDRRLFLLRISDQISRDELAAQNAGLKQDSQTDALTGCANRRCSDDSLAAAWSRAAQLHEPIGLIMLDVDRFKAYNDHYGHQAGDVCLARVATLARYQMRGTDLLARYGGEEFAVILPGASLSASVAVAERIRAAVFAQAMPHLGVSNDAVVTVSLGVATLVPTADAVCRTLVETADRNLYSAKRGGRNRVISEIEPSPIKQGEKAALI